MADQGTRGSRGDSGVDWHPVREFTRALLEDLQALERMLAEGRLESGVRRIGAEQEMFLVDRRMRPAMTALEVLEKLGHPQVCTELGLFNLEINLTPRPFEDDCLYRLEQELEGLIAEVARAARTFGSRILLTGILPTLRKRDLTLDAMTPAQRYRELNRSTVEQRGAEFRLQIKGLDELNVTHDNVLMEACNTSFQLHFQVDPDEFVPFYNLAQAISAPVLAAAANSPTFLQHRLWHETRLALFQESIDSRSDAHRARQARPRVIFGDRWLQDSVLEVFREDITRFRIFLTREPGPSSLEMLDAGQIPPLAALCMHAGTVYRWNRACYGVTRGKPHLRIEHRALPAGPTVVDEVANASFFYGLMSALSREYGDITKVMSFDDAKTNFGAAARYGLKARLQWAGGEARLADDLILNTLIPLASAGLRDKGLRSSDVDRYLGIVEERVKSGRNGAQWMLDSLAEMGERGRTEERFRTVTNRMYDRSILGVPVHEWRLAHLEDGWEWLENYRRVEQVMTTDLFTVHPDDLVDLAANLMDWEHIRHVPVEDRDGLLVGLVSHRQLLRLIGRGQEPGAEPVAVRDIMNPDPITATPDLPTVRAIARMRERKVSCLPVVDGDRRLVGIVSERDFIHLTANLLDAILREADDDANGS